MADPFLESVKWLTLFWRAHETNRRPPQTAKVLPPSSLADEMSYVNGLLLKKDELVAKFRQVTLSG